MEKFVYEIINGKLISYELIKETPQKFFVQTRFGERWLSKDECFLSELEAWEHFDKNHRAQMKILKDKISVHQQYIQTAQKEIARLKR